MRYSLLKEMYEMEGDYWWHKAKRKHVLSLLKRFARLKNSKALDVGCGTGYFLKEIGKYSKAYGIDKSKMSLSFCRKRGLKNLFSFDIEKNAFATGKFEIATALDVIEHIRNDDLAMKNILRSLKRGGILVVVTPAFPQLWSYWDEVAGHFRRYNKKSIVRLFVDAGFKIEHISFTNFTIFLPAVIIRFIKEKFGSKNLDKVPSDFIKVPKFLNKFFYYVLIVEMIVSFYIHFPFGLSYIVVGRKA